MRDLLQMLFTIYGYVFLYFAIKFMILGIANIADDSSIIFSLAAVGNAACGMKSFSLSNSLTTKE